MMDRLSSFDGRFAAQTATGYGKPGLNAAARKGQQLIDQSNQRLAALREQAKANQSAQPSGFKAAFNATLSMAVQEIAKDTGLAAPLAAVKSVAQPIMEAAPRIAPAVYRQPAPTQIDVAPSQPTAQPQAVSQNRHGLPSPERVERVVSDVLNIAQKTGFLGVSPEDVRRAYQTGQSFLADYKV